MDQDLAVAAMARSDPGPLERIQDPGKIGLAAPEEQAVVAALPPCLDDATDFVLAILCR
jgi:hypothetical protein